MVFSRYVVSLHGGPLDGERFVWVDHTENSDGMPAPRPSVLHVDPRTCEAFRAARRWTSAYAIEPGLPLQLVGEHQPG